MSIHPVSSNSPISTILLSQTTSSEHVGRSPSSSFSSAAVAVSKKEAITGRLRLQGIIDSVERYVARFVQSDLCRTKILKPTCKAAKPGESRQLLTDRVHRLVRDCLLTHPFIQSIYTENEDIRPLLEVDIPRVILTELQTVYSSQIREELGRSSHSFSLSPRWR